MARARMVTNEITKDKRVNSLSSPWSMLGFSWLITFSDCEGRTYGDPSIVRSMLFPRHPEITVEMTEEFIREWAGCGLIVWYEADDDAWIWFPNFDKNQPGLRKEREPISVIPAFDPDKSRLLSDNLPDDIRQSSGSIPDDILLKRREEKRKEVKRREEKGNPPPLSTSLDLSCEKMVLKATGWTAIPQSERVNAIDAVRQLQATHPPGWDVVTFITPFYKEAQERYRHTTKLFWLTDWALAGQIPDRPAPKDNGNKTFLGTDVNGDPVYE